MADEFRREMDKVGPGGVKCDCCNQFHGKEKSKLNRIVRSRIKSRTATEILREANGVFEDNEEWKI